MGEDFGTNRPKLVGVRMDAVAISLVLSLCTITKRVESCIQKQERNDASPQHADRGAC